MTENTDGLEEYARAMHELEAVAESFGVTLAELAEVLKATQRLGVDVEGPTRNIDVEEDEQEMEVMSLPEKTAFTLAEFGQQFGVDEDTVIDWWRQRLLTFCLRWERAGFLATFRDSRDPFCLRWDGTGYLATDSDSSDPIQTQHTFIEYGTLLRPSRCAIGHALIHGEACVNSVGLEELAEPDTAGPVSIYYPPEGHFRITPADLLVSKTERDRFRAEWIDE